jgi:hypothetical protein
LLYRHFQIAARDALECGEFSPLSAGDFVAVDSMRAASCPACRDKSRRPKAPTSRRTPKSNGDLDIWPPRSVISGAVKGIEPSRRASLAMKLFAHCFMLVGLLGMAFALGSFHGAFEDKTPSMYPGAEGADDRPYIRYQRVISGMLGGFIALGLGAYLRGIYQERKR